MYIYIYASDSPAGSRIPIGDLYSVAKWKDASCIKLKPNWKKFNLRNFKQFCLSSRKQTLGRWVWDHKALWAISWFIIQVMICITFHSLVQGFPLVTCIQTPNEKMQVASGWSQTQTGKGSALEISSNSAYLPPSWYLENSTRNGPSLC